MVQMGEPMPGEPNSTLGAFCRDGFAKLPELVTGDELATAQRHARELLEGDGVSFRQYVPWAEDGQWRSELFVRPSSKLRLDFLGLFPALDAVMESVLARPVVESALQQILGSGRQLWYATIRRALAGERQGVRLHHDIAGETGLLLLLADAPDKEGGMVWVRGSHRWPRVLESFPFLYPAHFPQHVVGATGRAGDAYLFSNSTWHGRLPARSRDDMAIVLTFLPAAHPRTTRRAPPEIVDRLGSRLRALLRPPDASPGDGEGTPTGDPLLQDLIHGRTALAPLSPWHAVRLAAAAAAPLTRLARRTRRAVRTL